MKTISISKKLSFSKKRLDFALLPVEHDEVEYEYDEIKNNSCVEEEPPAWHEAVLKKREWEWEHRNVLSRNFEEVFRDLRANAASAKK